MNKRRRASHCGDESFCKQRFPQPSDLVRHQRSHSGEKEKPYHCQQCKKRFSRKTYLVLHMRIHTGEKPYQCQHCNKRFSQSCNLLLHTRVHTGEKPYQCQLCKKRFSSSSNLGCHMRIHTGQRPYQCQQCNKCFSQSISLECHMRTHTGAKPYQCQQCSKCFSQSSALAVHVRIHTGDKPYQCQQCKKRFSQSGHLVIHLRTHTGEKPYQCQLCKKRFSSSTNLGCHMRIHTGPKPYQCAHSGKTLSCDSSPARHQRIHSEDKTHLCQQCNERFSQSSSYLTINTGEKSHQCVGCKERFSTARYLAVHLSAHIGRNPYGCYFCSKRFSQNFRPERHLQTHTAKIQVTRHQDVCGKISVSSYTCFPLLPTQTVLLDDLTTLVEVNDSDLTSFQAGYYGTTPVTLGFLPAIAAIEIVSSLQPCLHPNIAMFYGMTLMSGSCTTLVMERVTTSLSHVLDEIGDQLSLRERLDIAVGCLSAVDYLHHQLGVNHGMLTCDYVFLSNSFAAKVLDPMVASLIDMSLFHTCDAMEDDIRQLGHILLSVFRGVVLNVDSNVCDESGECCAPHRLHTVLNLMINGEEADLPSTKAIISVLENMRLTDQYI